MAEVSYAEFDDKEVRDFLNQMDKKLKKIENGHKEFGGLMSAIVYQDVMKHFDEEQGSSGPWNKWSSSYKEKLKKEGRSGAKLLQDTGKLRNNFKPQKFRKVSSGLIWFNDAKVQGGFPYAAAHDVGGSKLPQRDFMWLSDDAMEKISNQTLQYLIDKGI